MSMVKKIILKGRKKDVERFNLMTLDLDLMADGGLIQWKRHY